MSATPPSLFAWVGSPMGNQIAYWCPRRDSPILHRLRGQPEHARGIIVDVGSFDGRDAVNFAGSSGLPVWTFEPTPSKHPGIRRTIDRHGLASNVTLYPYALSNRSGEATMEVFTALKARGRQFMQGKPGSAQDFLTMDVRPTMTKPSTAVVSVPVRRLDDLLDAAAVSTVPYMKIDAQGQDTLVLRGAVRLLSEYRVAAFAFEFSPYLIPGRYRTALDDLTWLETLRYACVPCQKTLRLRGPMPIAAFVDYFRNGRDTENSTDYTDIACRPPPKGAPSHTRRS